MKTNKELTPIELLVYMYRNKADTKVMTMIRDKETVFAMSIEKDKPYTKNQWEQMKFSITKGCCQSMSFYKRFGIEYFSATPEQQKQDFIRTLYKCVEIIDNEVVNS